MDRSRLEDVGFLVLLLVALVPLFVGDTYWNPDGPRHVRIDHALEPKPLLGGGLAQQIEDLSHQLSRLAGQPLDFDATGFELR